MIERYPHRDDTGRGSDAVMLLGCEKL
jgi:hypothetical protein